MENKEVKTPFGVFKVSEEAKQTIFGSVEIASIKEEKEE